MDTTIFQVVRLDPHSDPSIEALIQSYWIKCEKAANERAWEAWNANHGGEPPVANGVLCKGLHRKIEALLTRAAVAGVRLVESPDTILGFAVSEPGILHWVSVKEPFRRSGLALAMIKDLGLLDCGDLRISSRTPVWKSFARHCGLKVVFDPYAL